MKRREQSDCPSTAGDVEQFSQTTHGGRGSIITDPELKEICENIGDAAFTFNVAHHDGHQVSFFYSNAAHEQITSVTVDGYSGDGPVKNLRATIGEEVTEKYHGSVGTEKPLEYKEHLDHLTGTVEESTKITPIVEHGGAMQIIVVARDLTERKQYGQWVEVQCDMFEQTVESLPPPFYVTSVGAYTIEHGNSLADVSEGEPCYEVTHSREQPCGGGNERSRPHSRNRVNKPLSTSTTVMAKTSV